MKMNPMNNQTIETVRLEFVRRVNTAVSGPRISGITPNELREVVATVCADMEAGRPTERMPDIGQDETRPMQPRNTTDP